jgi:hypothetical protein
MLLGDLGHNWQVAKEQALAIPDIEIDRLSGTTLSLGE